MSRSGSFARNALWSFVLQVVTLVVGFLVPRSIIGAYGSQMNGLVSSLTQVVSYITLVEAGISSAAVFALYKPLAKGEIESIGIIVSAARRFYYRSGAVFVTLGIILALVYPVFVSYEGVSSLQVSILVAALCAPGFLDFFTLAKYRVLLLADQRNWVIQMASILYRILYAVAIVVLSQLKAPIEIVYATAIAPIILRTIILVAYTRLKYPDVDFKADSNGYVLDQRWDAFYLQVLGVVQAGFPVLVATFVIRDLRIVSIYSVYMLVANGIQQLCATVTNGTQSTFGDVIARGDYRTLRQTYSELGAMMGIINASAAGTAAVMIVPFVMLYTGDVADINYYAPLLGALVMLNTFLYHIKTPEGLLVISSGKYRESRPFVTCQALVLAIGSFVGALVGGIEGMVVGVCLSNIYAAAYLTFFIPDRVTHSRRWHTFRKYQVTIVAFMPAAIVSFLQLEPMPDSWGAWGVYTVATATITVVWSLAIFLLLDREPTLAGLRRAWGLVARR